MFVSVTKFIIAYSWEESDFFYNLCDILALLLCTRTILGDMSDGDDSYSLEVGRGEEATHDVGVEVAHPASAKIALRCSEAQMLGSYSHVDVAVLLVVVAACPALAVVLHAHDVERSSAEPIAVVCLPELFLSLLAAHNDKLHGWRLTADGASRTHSRMYAKSSSLTSSSVYLRAEKRVCDNSRIFIRSAYFFVSTYSLAVSPSGSLPSESVIITLLLSLIL